MITIWWRLSATALLQMNCPSTLGRYLSAHTYSSSPAIGESTDCCGDSTCSDDGLRKSLTQMFAPLATVVAVSRLQLLPTSATTSGAATALAWDSAGVSSRPTVTASSLSLKGLLAGTLAADAWFWRAAGGVDADDIRLYGGGGVGVPARERRGA